MIELHCPLLFETGTNIEINQMIFFDSMHDDDVYLFRMLILKINERKSAFLLVRGKKRRKENRF